MILRDVALIYFALLIAVLVWVAVWGAAVKRDDEVAARWVEQQRLDRLARSARIRAEMQDRLIAKREHN